MCLRQAATERLSESVQTHIGSVQEPRPSPKYLSFPSRGADGLLAKRYLDVKLVYTESAPAK